MKKIIILLFMFINVSNITIGAGGFSNSSDQNACDFGRIGKNNQNSAINIENTEGSKMLHSTAQDSKTWRITQKLLQRKKRFLDLIQQISKGGKSIFYGSENIQNNTGDLSTTSGKNTDIKPIIVLNNKDTTNHINSGDIIIGDKSNNTGTYEDDINNHNSDIRKKFTSKKLKFEIKYPKNYVVNEGEDSLCIKDKKTNFQWDLCIYISSSHDTLEEIMKKLTSVEFKNSKKIKLSEHVAYEGTDMGLTESYGIYTKKDQNVYRIIFRDNQIYKEDQKFASPLTSSSLDTNQKLMFDSFTFIN